MCFPIGTGARWDVNSVYPKSEGGQSQPSRHKFYKSCAGGSRGDAFAGSTPPVTPPKYPRLTFSAVSTTGVQVLSTTQFVDLLSFVSVSWFDFFEFFTGVAF